MAFRRFKGRSFGAAKRIGLGIEYECSYNSSDCRKAVLFVGTEYTPSGYGWLFPTNKGTLRVGVGVIRPDTDASPHALLDKVISQQFPERLGFRLGEVLETHAGTIPAEAAPSTLMFNRIVAVGNSAAQALPLVGEGIRYAIECGRALGHYVRKSVLATGDPAIHAGDYVRWWHRRYRRSFSIAQAINEKISCFGDEQWANGLALLRHCTPNDVARLLRMEFTASAICRIAARNPGTFARHAVKRLFAA